MSAALCALAALHRSDTQGAAGWLQTAPATEAPGRTLPLIEVFLWEPCTLAPIQRGLAHAHEGGNLTAWQAVRDQVARAEAGTQLTCGLRVRLCALRALAHGGMGVYGTALRALRDALDLAAPGCFITPFREVGPELRALAWSSDVPARGAPRMRQR